MSDSGVPADETEQETRARMNGEVAKIPWTELQRHFARGVIMRVAPELDLVEVAVAVVRDDSGKVAGWVDSGSVARATDDDARTWMQRFKETSRPMWAVVAAPWVLVQEVRCDTSCDLR